MLSMLSIFFEALSCERLSDDWLSGTSGSMKKISQRDIERFDVLWPPNEKRLAFAKLIIEVDRLRDEKRAASVHYHDLFHVSPSPAPSLANSPKRGVASMKPNCAKRQSKRDEWLKTRGFQRSTVSATVVEPPVVSGNALLTRLSPTQQRVYALTQNHPATYFTLQTLWEAQNDDAPLDRDIIERGLSMLEALGVILRVRVPVSPTGEAFYQSVYRRATALRLGRRTARPQRPLSQYPAMKLRYVRLERSRPPLRNLALTFPQDLLLSEQPLALRFIVGLNGSGKTTLLQTLAEIFATLDRDGQPPSFPLWLAYDLHIDDQPRTVYLRAPRSQPPVLIVFEKPLPEKTDWEAFTAIDPRTGAWPEGVAVFRQFTEALPSGGEFDLFLPSAVLAYTSGQHPRLGGHLCSRRVGVG